MITLPLTVLVVAAFYRIVGCPILRLTGISCLGCGMTRAWMCVLILRFADAFAFHPLWLLPPVFLALYLFLRPRNGKLFRMLGWGMAALFVLAYGYRLMVHDPVLQVDYTQGLIWRGFSFARELFGLV